MFALQLLNLISFACMYSVNRSATLVSFALVASALKAAWRDAFGNTGTTFEHAIFNFHRNSTTRMTQAATKARIKYLAASAQLYSHIAPETSAHLMLQCGSFAASNDIALKMSDSQKACSACGTILTSGWTSRTSVADNPRNIKRQLKRRSERKGTNDERTKFVITQCLVCLQSTSSPLEHVTARFSSRKQNSMSQAAILGAASSPSRLTSQAREAKEEHQIPLPANLASKKRARARKQSGLHGMLQKSKSQNTGAPSPALDLMDFMKMA